jgi:polyhydroxyalkanoate synthesis regulator phasin
MNEERKRILTMLSEGKISAEEAERLMDALSRNTEKSFSQDPANNISAVKKDLKYLRVLVDSKQGDNVNIRIPVALLRAGLKLSALIPPMAYQKISDQLSAKGFDFDVNALLKNGDIEQIIESLGDLNIDVNSAQGDKVRVFFE